MAQGKEFAIKSLICGGARRDAQLQAPVIISIEKDESGERLISCPFINGYKGNHITVYFCEANTPTTLKGILPEIFNPVGNRNPSDTETIELIDQKLPRCLQKYPI